MSFAFEWLCDLLGRPPSDGVANLSISHRPAGPGGVSVLCMAFNRASLEGSIARAFLIRYQRERSVRAFRTNRVQREGACAALLGR
jgi:hypothetical protein